MVGLNKRRAFIQEDVVRVECETRSQQLVLLTSFWEAADGHRIQNHILHSSTFLTNSEVFNYITL